jgi:hypothetical protein
MKEGDPVTDKLWGDLLLMMGFASGLYWFFDGFRVYRECGNAGNHRCAGQRKNKSAPCG